MFLPFRRVLCDLSPFYFTIIKTNFSPLLFTSISVSIFYVYISVSHLEFLQ